MEQIVYHLANRKEGFSEASNKVQMLERAETSTISKGTLSCAVEEVRKGKLTKVSSVAELMEKLDE